jgi:hypothetical protein
MTLMWGITMTIFMYGFCWWMEGYLPALVVVGLPLLCLLAGFGFATGMTKAMEAYGESQDDETKPK